MRDPARAAAVLAALCLATALPPTASATPGYVVNVARGTAQSVRLPAGQSATIFLAGEIGDIRVADPSVVEAAPLGAKSFYLLGVGPGRTTVSVYDADKAPLGVVAVEVGVDVVDLTRTIHVHVPDADVHVTTVNGRLRLSGLVPNGQALATVLDLAKQYVGEKEYINAIKVKESQQVLLEVRFIEASRQAGRELGINLGVTDPSAPGQGLVTGATSYATGSVGNNTVYTPGIAYPNAGRGTGAFRFPVTNNAAFATLITQIATAGLNVDIIIRALEQKGLGRSLAEPNLTALSGEEASFLAGGEFPYQTVDQLGNVKVEFKKYGVQLNFRPLVLGNGLINLKLVPEVSQIDPSLTLNGVPAIISRRTETTVELRDGQSFAISGLLQAVTEKQQDQVPWLGKVPILGTMFRSASYLKRETDLVVIVTPRLIRPAKPGEVLKTPLDASRNSTDAEFFLAGMMEVDEAALKRIAAGEGVNGPYGHVIDLSVSTKVEVYK
ncbi:MAG: type II and III secretion system protein family protein [Pseudomonadota bacterium]